MEFWSYLDKVGKMHVRQNLHIEYIHIGLTLSFIQDVLTEAILSHPKMRMERKIGLVKALSKVIWIQNDLFAKWYVNDGEEFAEDAVVLVPEVREKGTCPFEQPSSPLRREVSAWDGVNLDAEGTDPHRGEYPA